jgi:hypothetical protein
MPTFDRRCEAGHEQIDVWERSDAPNPPCPECGARTTRTWITKASAVVADDIPGGFVLEHVEPGRRVYSQSELRAVLASHGYAQHVEHVPQKGSDKSRHTVRWTSVPYTPTAEHQRREMAKFLGLTDEQYAAQF